MNQVGCSGTGRKNGQEWSEPGTSGQLNLEDLEGMNVMKFEKKQISMKVCMNQVSCLGDEYRWDQEVTSLVIMKPDKDLEG